MSYRAGHRHIIIQLLAHEADPEIPTDDGWLPIHLSAISGHLSCVKELLTHVDNVDDVLTKDGFTLLHVAARFNHVNIIDYLVSQCNLAHKSDGEEEKMVDNRENPAQHTPLHVAAGACNVEDARCLIRHGANVNARTIRLNTALHMACQQGYVEIVELLLDNNVITVTDHLGRNAAGWPPLHLAVFEGHTNIMNAFLKYRPNLDLNQPISGGDRLLHVAIRQIFYEIIEILVSKDADPLLGGYNGLSALSFAQHAGDTKAFELLEPH